MKSSKNIILVILLLVAFVFSSSLLADDIDDLSKALDKLEKQMKKLKEKKSEEAVKSETKIYKKVEEKNTPAKEEKPSKTTPEKTDLSYAEEEVPAGLEISGFFDVVNSYDRSDEDNSNFGLGQAEVDLANQVTNNVAVEVAIAYNSDDGLFELGAAIVDIHLFGNGGGNHVNSSFIDHSSIVVGQFDVPFGIDYFSYPSIERKFITAPRVVDMTHEGWNDFGAQFVMDSKYGNFVAYVVNGFEASAEVLDQVATLATGVDVFEEVNTTPSNAFGSRIGFKPFSKLEIGSSFAVGLNKSEKSEMTLWGADMYLDFGFLAFKGEYINHSLNRSVAKEDNKGYYFQSIGFINQFFVSGRYGSFKPDGAEWIGQFSFGGGYSLAENIELRVETLFNENSDLNQTMFQLVTGF
jgi:Sec-independent protein translocase protein TatA